MLAKGQKRSAENISCVIAGGLCALLASFILEDEKERARKSLWEHLRSFDVAGSIFFVAGLVLILIAMIQAVVADPVLSQTGSLVGLVVGGVVSGLIFIADQFLVTDPLIPPDIFVNRVFATCCVCGTIMAFVRNSITYGMIFFLQGPLARDPLQAGIQLIPYGVGTMVGGFVSGGLADRFGVRPMIITGPLITLIGVACLSVMDQHTSDAYVGGVHFLAGLGLGVFQSPNIMATMLSIPADRRGVAAAIGILTMTFCMMVGMVLTFSLVLHSITSEQLFAIFVNGGGISTTSASGAADTAAVAAAADSALHGVLGALATDFYVIMTACGISALVGASLPADLLERLKHSPAAETTDAGAGPAASKATGLARCEPAKATAVHAAVDVVLCSSSSSESGSTQC